MDITRYNRLYMRNERAKRAKQGKCVSCGTRPAKRGIKTCQVCRDYQNQYHRERRIA